MPVHAPTRIKELRLQAGMSVSELANRLGLTQPNVSKIENSRISVSLDLLFRIADVFHVPVSELIKTEPSRQTHYAAVLGELETASPAELFEPPYELIPVPLAFRQLVPAIPVEAFRTKPGWLYGVLHFPRPEDNRRRFVIQHVNLAGRRTLQERVFESNDSVAGFSTDKGPPSERWLPADDNLIEKIWRIIGEFRAA
jgi:transcriptional regulator with XRE-family HTH domain